MSDDEVTVESPVPVEEVASEVAPEEDGRPIWEREGNPRPVQKDR